MIEGLIEAVTPDFVQGWAATGGEAPAWLIAECNGRMLGATLADIDRPDLQGGEAPRRAFLILFASPLAAADLPAVRVWRWNRPEPLPRGARVRIETGEPLRIFILGSPRSGTSQLAAALSDHFQLPWFGEGHAAHWFAAAARALAGDPASGLDMPRAMAALDLARTVREAARRTYFAAHASASFLDKTPGVAMIEAAPFLAECFPGARFIFLRRNGVANVLSRQAKFGGGVFQDHCADWARAMDAWERVRGQLPHHLEIEQETMLADPAAIAGAVAAYLERPEAAAPLAQALAAGNLERTGAGLGRTTLAETAWTEEEIAQFRAICAPAMARWGYPLD